MSKKDYVLIADVINSYYKAEVDGSYYNLAEGMADILANENPRFDRVKFFTACNKGLEAV